MLPDAIRQGVQTLAEGVSAYRSALLAEKLPADLVETLTREFHTCYMDMWRQNAGGASTLIFPLPYVPEAFESEWQRLRKLIPIPE